MRDWLVRGIVWGIVATGGMLIEPTASIAARPFLTTEEADPVEKGQSRFELGIHFQRFSLDDLLTVMQLEVTNGMLNDLDFEVELPILFLQSGGSGQNGLGDVKLKAKVRVVRAREGRPVSLAVQVIVKLPTCDDKNTRPACTGKTDVGLLAIASKSFRSVDVHLNVGYTFIATPSSPAAELRDTVNYALGFDYPLESIPMHLYAEVTGQTSSDTSEANHPLSVFAGMDYEVLEGLAFDFGLEVGLTSPRPQIGASGGLTYLF